MNEMLQGIRGVKLYGWEDFANELIHEIRQKEIGLLCKYNRLRLANAILMILAPTLLNLVCSTTTIALGYSLDVDDIRVTGLVDGVGIATITVHQLRTKMTIIPQDPMLFSGSLRMNLDPFAEKSDSELWEVLRKVHLSDTVSTWGKGLDYEVAEKGENLSVGQRQLLCIARALIRDSKVIVMDEATANVDQESDKLIQQTMKESFGGGASTVLCIAHRIETIMDSDKILVLDAGEMVEYDTPETLLKRKSGAFKALVESCKNKLS